MIGLYQHPPTILHRVSAGYKLIALAVLSIVCMRIGNVAILAACLGALLAVYAGFGKPFVRRLAILRPLWPTMLAIFVAQIIVADWQSATASILRLLVMVLLADLVTMSTRMQAMMDALAPLLRPLRMFGVSSERISFCVAYVIRLVPLLLEQWQLYADAWRARTGNRPGWRLIAPLFANILRMAGRHAEALDARGFGASRQ